MVGKKDGIIRMRILDIINEGHYRHNHNIDHFIPSDLSFVAIQKDEDQVEYIISSNNGRRIGSYTLWDCADTVFIWSNLKAPDKSHIFKLMGIIPDIVVDYMNNGYYPEGSHPDEFSISFDNAIQIKRFNEWDYYYYTNNRLPGDYRITRNANYFKIYPPKNTSSSTGQ